MADSSSGEGGPQPFAYLSAPNAALYGDVLRAFAKAKARFIVHLRPEDVAAELNRAHVASGGVPGEGGPDGDRPAGPPAVPAPATDEQVAAALDRLVGWGNLRADADTGRVTTVEDFHRRRFLYQLTAEGHAAEQAIAFYEEAIGRRGVLQSVALNDIADQLAGLAALAAEARPDPGKVHLALLALADRFASLADNAQAFMTSLRRAIDFSDGDVDGFVAYKERLIDYIERFIGDLATSGSRIARLIGELEECGHGRLLALAARREASDAVPDGADAAEALARHEAEALDAWRNRWRGLRDWFVSGGASRPSQARMLRQAAVTAVRQLVDTVKLLNERRSGRSDRSADFRTLARWFAEAPDGGDGADLHRLWRAAFGLTSARHLTVTAATVAAWADDDPQGAPWAAAPPVRISPQLRRTGSYERRGKPNRVQDRSDAKRLLREHAEREAAETAAARARLRTGGPVLLSEFGELDPRAFRLFLALLGDALAARLPGDTEVKVVTGDGSMEVRLSPVPDGGEVRIVTPDGVLTGPEHLIEITDLGGAA